MEAREGRQSLAVRVSDTPPADDPHSSRSCASPLSSAALPPASSAGSPAARRATFCSDSCASVVAPVSVPSRTRPFASAFSCAGGSPAVGGAAGAPPTRSIRFDSLSFSEEGAHEKALAGYACVVEQSEREAAAAGKAAAASLPPPPSLPPFVFFSRHRFPSALPPEILGAHAALCLQRGEAPMVPDWIYAPNFSPSGSEDEASRDEGGSAAGQAPAAHGSASPSAAPSSSPGGSSASPSPSPFLPTTTSASHPANDRKAKRQTRVRSRKLLKDIENLGAPAHSSGETGEQGRREAQTDPGADAPNRNGVGEAARASPAASSPAGTMARLHQNGGIFAGVRQDDREKQLHLQLVVRLEDKLQKLQQGKEGGGVGLGALRRLLELLPDTKEAPDVAPAASALPPASAGRGDGKTERNGVETHEAAAEKLQTAANAVKSEEAAGRASERVDAMAGEASATRWTEAQAGGRGKESETGNPFFEEEARQTQGETADSKEGNGCSGEGVAGAARDTRAAASPKTLDASNPLLGAEEEDEPALKGERIDVGGERKRGRQGAAENVGTQGRPRGEDGKEAKQKRRRGQHSAAERSANTQQIWREAHAQAFCLRMAGCGVCEGLAEGKVGSVTEKDSKCEERANSASDKGGPVECRKPHDLKAFLQSRPADIQTRACPFLEAKYPFCPYGICCQFGASHIDAEGYNIHPDGRRVTPEDLDALQRRLHTDEEQNVLSPFTAKRIIQESRRRANSEREAGHNGNSPQSYLSGSPSPSVSSSPALPASTPPVSTAPFPRPSTSAMTSSSTGSSSASCLSPAGESGPHEQESCRVGSLSSLSVRERRALTQEKFRKRLVDSPRGKGRRLILAPLTTVGNLPFRRLCVELGAEVTVSEMAVAKSVADGKHSELALLKRHKSEKFFGVQLAGGCPDVMNACCDLLASEEVSCDFVDVNAACPLVQLHRRFRAGACMIDHPARLEAVVEGMTMRHPEIPLTVKLRTANQGKNQVLHSFIQRIGRAGAAALIIHGRTAQQRYTKAADWRYVAQCRETLDASIPIIGSGDVFSSPEFEFRLASGAVDGLMIARGALIKPWIFTEIAEQKIWDISASERLDLLKKFVGFGLEHWGSDSRGVATTRRFLLELLSFQHRYVPPPFFEFLPQMLQWRPSSFVARSDLEQKMSSPSVKDWIDICSLLLGPPPPEFSFVPKHASNSYINIANSPASSTALTPPPQSADTARTRHERGLLADLYSFFRTRIVRSVNGCEGCGQ
ncbi:dihydrouridine synthase (dus) protein [Besnoitia besnoiti]|uniref:tRNA-dihydrouridine(47) synthase [NAD(P)(+)] n=1 Tax=Besnoitia besnoiti TaxID=94643 RepID=A0A2A9M935_BESBE|nr:dihydrouridine synthase (dus) protein [Besnoitia besnoiti]PFH34998.1 dihydrouridine synthase (dus) protein [Besnoitia besnoiti]